MIADAEREMAARKYCEILGLDPNELLSYIEQDGKAVPDPNSAQWKAVARRIQQHEAMMEAMEYAQKYMMWGPLG